MNIKKTIVSGTLGLGLAAGSALIVSSANASELRPPIPVGSSSLSPASVAPASLVQGSISPASFSFASVKPGYAKNKHNNHQKPHRH